MKLTLDSSEPLEDAMRVLGAVYGVELVVSSNGDARKSSTPTKPRAKGRKRSAARKKSQSNAPVVEPDAELDAEPDVETDVAEEAADTGGEVETRSSGSPSNAEVRSWARDNGLTVSDRGRVPASVIAAYREALAE